MKVPAGRPLGRQHDQAEQYERLRQGAEALAQLKPQEIRALLLRAEGYSYGRYARSPAGLTRRSTAA
jgi:hypothetical protein